MSASSLALSVRYEDNHLLVLEKPAGVLTQSDATDRPCLHQMAKAWLKAKYHKPGNVFLGMVHRLDRPVSGLVLFAKTSKAASRISALIREGVLEKRYWALVSGQGEPPGGELIHYLGGDATQAIEVSARPRPDFKKAILEYRLLERVGRDSLVEVTLVTGRRHQIRAQLAAAGWPIVGDRRYGGRQWGGQGIALHATRLVFPHPTTGAAIVVESIPTWRKGA